MPVVGARTRFGNGARRGFERAGPAVRPVTPHGPLRGRLSALGFASASNPTCSLRSRRCAVETPQAAYGGAPPASRVLRTSLRELLASAPQTSPLTPEPLHHLGRQTWAPPPGPPPPNACSDWRFLWLTRTASSANCSGTAPVMSVLTSSRIRFLATVLTVVALICAIAVVTRSLEDRRSPRGLDVHPKPEPWWGSWRRDVRVARQRQMIASLITKRVRRRRNATTTGLSETGIGWGRPARRAEPPPVPLAQLLPALG